MKRKWYLQTWFIGALLFLWPFVIPGIAGIILLILQYANDRKLWQNYSNLESQSHKYDATKNDLDQLQEQYASLEKMLTPEMKDARELQLLISNLQSEKESELSELEQIHRDTKAAVAQKEQDLQRFDREIANRKKQIIQLDDEILVQEFGLYKPQYNFASALDYKEKLEQIRARQKELIKQKSAVVGNTNWEVNGSKAQGRKMVNDTQKLLLRAFNNECDDLISRVKYTNFDASLDRIYKSADTISKLGTVMGISINQNYLNLKIKELRLAFEYAQKKQQEKEEQKAARAEQREQARIQKEIDEQRKKVEKEQSHYRNSSNSPLKMQTF